ncbi:MAG: hypothetical protein NVS4B1_36550 [Ktedonobacteraceae bacterium]
MMERVRHDTRYHIAVDAMQHMLTSCPFQALALRLLSHSVFYENGNEMRWDALCDLTNGEQDYKALVALIQEMKHAYPRIAWLHCLAARALWPLGCVVEARHELDLALSLAPDSPLARALSTELTLVS